jgi:site-specific DNA-cytosine methylase
MTDNCNIFIKDIVGFESEIPCKEDVIDEVKKYTSRDFQISISKKGRIRPHRFDHKKSGISEVGTLVNPNDKCVAIIASHTPKTYKSNPFKIYELNVNECEAIQGVPKNYTSIVSERQAKKMLGNAWTVDVVAHIFKNIIT